MVESAQQPGSKPRVRERVAAGARRLDRHPKLLFAAKFARELLA